MTTVTHPIVGGFHRPPALALTRNLPIGTELLLVPEPDNPHDEFAVAVWLPPDSLRNLELTDDLDADLAGYGCSLDELQTKAESVHLGYLPRTVAKTLAFDGPTKGSFTTGANGGPRIRFDLS